MNLTEFLTLMATIVGFGSGVVTLITKLISYRKEKESKREMEVNIHRHPIFSVIENWRVVKLYEINVGKEKSMKTPALRRFTLIFMDAYEKVIKEQIEYYNKTKDIDLIKLHTEAVSLLRDSSVKAEFPPEFISMILGKTAPTFEVIKRQIQDILDDNAHVYNNDNLKMLYNTLTNLSSHFDKIIQDFVEIAILMNGWLDEYLEKAGYQAEY